LPTAAEHGPVAAAEGWPLSVRLASSEVRRKWVLDVEDGAEIGREKRPVDQFKQLSRAILCRDSTFCTVEGCTPRW
jgi:hypothetical protein